MTKVKSLRKKVEQFDKSILRILGRKVSLSAYDITKLLFKVNRNNKDFNNYYVRVCNAMRRLLINKRVKLLKELDLNSPLGIKKKIYKIR